MDSHAFPVNFARLNPGSRPRFFLALPEGFASTAQPHLRLAPMEGPPEALLARFKAVALASPRTRLRQESGLQIELEQKTAVWRFTDLITVEAVEAANDRAVLAIWSRALVGYYDFGVNRRRVLNWLDALQADGRAK